MKASNSTTKRRILQMLVMLSSLFIGSAAVADGSTDSAINTLHHLNHVSIIGLTGNLALIVGAFLFHLGVLFVCERSGLMNTLLNPHNSRV